MKYLAAKKYRSKIMAAIHETAYGSYKSGVMDEKTMREFDELCLTSNWNLRDRDVILSRKSGEKLKVAK
jgi:putative transcriptional regulator